ncbi:MAG: adenylate/guanylate cyclase domain-containing protein [Alphaproteobacteria bacterium]
MTEMTKQLPAGSGAGDMRVPKKRRRRMKMSIGVALVGGVVLLVLLSVGGVLAVSLSGAAGNTLSLLRDKADITLALLDGRIRSQLDPVEASTVQLAEWLADGTVDLDDPAGVATILTGALSALPQAIAAVFADTSGTLVRVVNRGGDARVVDETNLADDQVVRLAFDLAGQTGPTWLAPRWASALGQPVLRVGMPVSAAGRDPGVVVIAIALGAVSDYLDTLEGLSKATAFVLYDERHVLAHKDLVEVAREFRASDQRPLPPLSAFDDPGFALLTGDLRPGHIDEFSAGSFQGRNDDNFLVLTRALVGYGPRAFQIGLTFRDDDVNEPVKRLVKMAVVGVIILIVAAIIGLKLGKSITRQIRNLTDAAERLRSLDLTDAQAVPDSRFRELSTAAESFNAMIGALRMFETYVPKALVQRLMQVGEAATASQERQVTVMFTDIVGFSALAEKMSAIDTAAFLNRHFEMLSNRIEAEGGTVDKYMGDGVMAFWGAPDDMDDHAARALRAVGAIQEGLARENERAAARGEPPLRLRIGVHSGTVLVGNIGSQSRTNYTVVGDTVNAASRLQALGKEVEAEGACVVLCSAETLAQAGDRFRGDSIGVRQLKGRMEAFEVYRLTRVAPETAS